jgi:hypothetical protein
VVGRGNVTRQSGTKYGRTVRGKVSHLLSLTLHAVRAVRGTTAHTQKGSGRASGERVVFTQGGMGLGMGTYTYQSRGYSTGPVHTTTQEGDRTALRGSERRSRRRLGRKEREERRERRERRGRRGREMEREKRGRGEEREHTARRSVSTYIRCLHLRPAVMSAGGCVRYACCGCERVCVARGGRCTRSTSKPVAVPGESQVPPLPWAVQSWDCRRARPLGGRITLPFGPAAFPYYEKG